MGLEKGLKGVVAAETSISFIDGEKGKLIYRGFDVNDIALNHSFEEVAYLLWFGEFPDKSELIELKNEMKEKRVLSNFVKQLINLLPIEMDMMSVLRTVISALGRSDYGWKPTIAQAVQLTAIIPTIIAYRKRKLEGKDFINPDETLDHVANYLYMLNGTIPDSSQVNALETYMILTLEHGMNASTFSARVTASTESDLVSAITSAIGTMKGPLHGGAPSGVIKLLNEIDSIENIEKVLRRTLENKQRLMGFGHRVYKTKDPRSLSISEKLKSMNPEDKWLELALHVEEEGIRLLKEYKPGRELYTNVEFYAAAIMKSINMVTELFTPTFTASRVVGWTAHVLEQAQNNTIFRPNSHYIGKIVD